MCAARQRGNITPAPFWKLMPFCGVIPRIRIRIYRRRPHQGRPAASLAIMHFARAHKRLTAWLGLVAMVLVLFVPMVSQALEWHELQAFEQAAPLCKVKPSASINTDLSAEHDMPAGHHAACGYCDLLAGHVLVPTTVPPMPATAHTHATAWPQASGRLAMHQARHVGRPRDSPFLL